MNPSKNTSVHNVASLKVGDDYGFYQIIEFSPSRICLRANYATGLILLVVGFLVGVFDVMIFSNAKTVVSIMKTFHLSSFYGFRDFLHGLPDSVKGAMFILPIIGFGWFFLMTGRSVLVDFTNKIARRVKFFVFGKKVNLDAVASLQLRISPTSTSGDLVYLHLLDAQQQSLMEFQSEIAHEDELESTTTDYAKMISLAAFMAGILHVPITRQGAPSKMSAINRTMLEAVSSPG